MLRFNRVAASALSSLALVMISSSGATLHAQGFDFGGGGGTPSEATIAIEYIERQNVDERLQPHESGLLGDQIDLNTGSVTFSHVDVSIPGNSHLEVAIRRTRGQSFPFAYKDAATGSDVRNSFYDWTLDTPTISVVVASQEDMRDFCNFQGAQGAAYNFYTPGDPNPPNPAIDVHIFDPDQISNGLMLNIPGSGSQQILNAAQGVNWPTSTIKATTNYWALACGPADNNAQGLVATAPNGDVYEFDRFSYRPEVAIPVTQGDRSGAIPRRRATLFVSEVTDVHGNWVRYDYDSENRVTRIHANDGREILINRDVYGVIQTVTANGRTWTYGYGSTYGNTYLTSVTLPDNRQWSFDLTGFGFGANPAFDCQAADQTHTITHPDGITGTFVFRETRHLKGYTGNDGPTASCLITTPQHQPYYDHMSLLSRTLSGTGYPSATWNYAYSGWNGGTTVPSTKWGEVTEPDGTRTRSTYHRDGDLEGLALRTEVFDGVTLMRSTEHQYTVEGALGTTYLLNENQAKLTRPRLTTTTTVSQDGDTYTTTNAYNSSQASASYSFGQPITTTRSSTVQSGSRITNTTYAHNLSSWIIGLPFTTTQNGVVTASNTYDTNGNLTRQDQFGALYATFGYHSDGNLAWVRDALSRQVTLNNYHRGTAQQVIRPDGISLTRNVDNQGRLTYQTDGRGAQTSYSYDMAGRLTQVNRPSPIPDTQISYANLGAGLRQTIDTGSQRTVVHYDAMLRAYLVEAQALSGGGSTVYTRSSFDALNRTVFTSLPSHSSSATNGADTTYDALGRVIQVRENIAPFATTTTAYLSGNRTQTTNAIGAVTTATRSGWGGRGDGEILSIAQPEGVLTTMSYDALGFITSATQGGGGVSQTQTWAYDSRRRLCRHVTPESGATLYVYDNANQMIGMGRGMPSGSSCGSIPSSYQVSYAYDSLSRVTDIYYPAGTQNIAMTYDANGNVTRNARGSAIWDYVYDVGDRLTSETLSIDGRTYQTRYTFDGNGAHASTITALGRNVQFAPDGFGRATESRIGSYAYADNVTYHANGQISAFDYGNGFAYSSTQNARQQTTSIRSVLGSTRATDFAYGYDALGRVTSITDNARSGQNRSFTYDGLDRLITASGPWGSGSFSYDALGNITQQVLGSRVVDIQYNSANQVSQARDSANGNVWRSYSHDSRGNVSSNGLISFTYDHANQPTAISGSDTGNFTYDGNMRRVKQTINGETIYTVYSASGRLLLRDNATTGEPIDYVPLGGRTIIQLKNPSSTFMHWDHLGSAVAGTDTSGLISWQEDYTPFGESRQNPAGIQDNESYTGHIQDTDTGLTYMQARYYDPAIGRFLSTDPVGFIEGGPTYFNRYAYVGNNPINMTDPTGEVGLPGFVFGAAFDVGMQMIVEGRSLGEVDVGRAAVAGVAGATGLGALQQGARVLRAYRGARNAQRGLANARRRTERATSNGQRRSREYFERGHENHLNESVRELVRDSAVAIGATGGAAVAKEALPDVTVDDVVDEINDAVESLPDPAEVVDEWLDSVDQTVGS